MTSITRPADLVTTYAYDALSRVTAIDHVHDGTPLLELGYVHDALGRLTSRTDDAGTITFGYDDLDRLTAADFPWSGDYAYGYDAVGNVTSVTSPSGTITRTHDDADRIDSTGFVYDDTGALLTDGTRSPPGTRMCCDSARASPARGRGSPSFNRSARATVT